MPTTMKLIGKTTLGGNATNVEFSSIPGTYTDLLVVASPRTDRSNSTFDSVELLLNGDTASNMTARTLRGNGSAASSFSSSAAIKLDIDTCAAGATATSDTFGSLEIYIPNYAGSTNKSLSITSAQETNASTAYIGATAALWAKTDAVTTVRLEPGSGTNFVSGSSFFLYGITKA
jgi:hypothetical protein